MAELDMNMIVRKVMDSMAQTIKTGTSTIAGSSVIISSDSKPSVDKDGLQEDIYRHEENFRCSFLDELKRWCSAPNNDISLKDIRIDCECLYPDSSDDDKNAKRLDMLLTIKGTPEIESYAFEFKYRGKGTNTKSVRWKKYRDDITRLKSIVNKTVQCANVNEIITSTIKKGYAIFLTNAQKFQKENVITVNNSCIEIKWNPFYCNDSMSDNMYQYAIVVVEPESK